jgi:hypothetical protein
MANPIDVYSTVEARRVELGLSQADLSRIAFGKSGNSAIQNLKTSDPGFSRVEALARALNLDIYFGPKRHAPGFAEGDMASDFGKAEALRAGYLPIPWHSRLGLKGSSPVSFAREWMLDRDLAPDNLVATPVERDTRGGPVARDLLAVVDKSARHTPAPAPWVYLVGGMAHLSDLEFRPTATIIHRYGADGSTWLLFDDERDQISLLGRAVWVGGLQ